MVCRFEGEEVRWGGRKMEVESAGNEREEGREAVSAGERKSIAGLGHSRAEMPINSK